MKKIEVKNPGLNGGRETQVYYPLSDEEFKNQFAEIFDFEDYRKGIKKNGVYVDIGANIGLTALYFAPFAKKYYAIEPSRACFEALKINTKHLKNIGLFNFGVWAQEGQTYLYQTAKDSVSQTLYSEKSQFGRETILCKRIDDFFEENKIKHVDVLKIDIEGAEYDILPSKSFENVADRVDLIIGESHFNSFNGSVPYIVPEVLKDYGFETKFLERKNMVYNFHYSDQERGEKTYSYRVNTMFVAKKA